MKQLSIILAAFLTIVLSSCGGGTPPPQPPSSAAAVPATLTAVSATAVSADPNTTFTLSSSAVAEGGALPQTYTCDGESATLPLAWHNAPEGTQSFALIMHHVPGPGDTHWYWQLYDIPATVDSLPQNMTGVGTLGNNSVNESAVYAPPCSKGAGLKLYTYTIYALSAAPQIDVPPEEVSRDVLLAAMQGLILDTAELNVTYTR